MPENTPRPPQHHPWETGWTDTSRAPGTRRLWLAGGLALATVVGCATSIAVMDRGADRTAQATDAPSPSDPVNDPGLISFGSPSPTDAPSPSGGKNGKGGKADEDDKDGEDDAGGDAPQTAGTPTPDSSAGAEPSTSPVPHPSSAAQPKPTVAWRSVRSTNFPYRYWQVDGGLVKLAQANSASERRNATFKLVKGLADGACYSFATADGSYLRHRAFVLRSERDDGSALFEKDATFCPRATSVSGAVRLESVNFPGRFLRHQHFRLRLDPFRADAGYRADSTFRLVDGVA
ncbi:AbfB domain-containing protein [Streptomyces sp. NPDC087425]|uniref:AbfB domain-containing protein n=1 Tax=Streptomyces sp. NPDC087425 TaxID=3365787 RepID=UPI0038053887